MTNIDYDSNGDVQYEDDLDADGNQQMVYPFETRFLQADGTRLTAACSHIVAKTIPHRVGYGTCYDSHWINIWSYRNLIPI